MESIHELFRQVEQHPDFAGGTVFVREDVFDAIFARDGVAEYRPEMVTDDILEQSRRIINNFIFEGIYTWADALSENMEVK